MPKLITDVVLKKNIENILTELVNSTFDWQEYTDSEISDILEITDEQAMELTKIINDQIIANNKLWSSSKTDAEIKNALIESNKYADELIGQISSISLEYVTTLPSSDIKSNVIYILQGSPNTLNVYNESTSSFVSVGDLDLDLTGYYTKTEVDNLLADKADDNTVVHADDVVQDLTTTSGTTVLSSAGLQTELDKKFDKSGILSAISDAPSDEKVLSEKAVVNAIPTDDYITNIALKKALVGEDSILDENCQYGTDILRFPLGIHRFGAQATVHYPELPPQAGTGVLYIKGMAPVGADFTTTPWQIRRYVYEDFTGDVYIRAIQTGATANVITHDSGWIKSLDAADVTQTINSSSTDTQVASAKAVYDSKYYNTFGLKCPVDKSPLDFAIENTTANMIIHFDSWGNSTSGRVAPWASYIGIKHRDSGQVSVIGITNNGNYRINTYIDGAWSGWRTVCTTKVDDVPVTDVTNFTNNYSSGRITYTVRNGICYVSVSNLKLVSTGTEIPICNNMPISAIGVISVPAESGGVVKGSVLIYTDDTLRVHYLENNVGLYCAFSYPVG